MNALTWGLIAIALYAVSCWYCYDIGWYRGNTDGIRWARVQVFGKETKECADERN
jgi:hypothetical protein